MDAENSDTWKWEGLLKAIYDTRRRGRPLVESCPICADSIGTKALAQNPDANDEGRLRIGTTLLAAGPSYTVGKSSEAAKAEAKKLAAEAQ